tara:strand:+ start:79 stop:561 length:483 start_codon:yes stop_codon:yes gene_type:complete
VTVQDDIFGLVTLYNMENNKFNLDKFDKGIFLVNTLGVIFDPSNKKFLIARRENDPNVKDLNWVFPGGTPSHDEDLEESFERVIHERTGFEVKSLGPIFSRLATENDKILLIYYLCEAINGEFKTNEDLVEFKWVHADELEKHFTTSFDPRLKEFIENLK